MYKEDLALNNLQWLICHKTHINETIQIPLKKSRIRRGNLALEAKISH